MFYISNIKGEISFFKDLYSILLMRIKYAAVLLKTKKKPSPLEPSNERLIYQNTMLGFFNLTGVFFLSAQDCVLNNGIHAVIECSCT